MKNLNPTSLPPPTEGWKNGAFLPFARLHPWLGGDGGLLFHFILSKIAILDKTNGKPRPLLPPSPAQIKDGKTARFCPSRGFILDLGGWGFAVPFYFVQDCRSSWQWIRACALRHSGAMTHVLYYKFKTATKTAQICDQPKECEESGRKWVYRVYRVYMSMDILLLLYETVGLFGVIVTWKNNQCLWNWKPRLEELVAFFLQVSFEGQRSEVTGYRSQVTDKVGRRNLNLVIQCCKNTVAVAFLRISCGISSKFVLYWYLFTLRNKRRDVVTKAVSFR